MLLDLRVPQLQKVRKIAKRVSFCFVKPHCPIGKAEDEGEPNPQLELYISMRGVVAGLHDVLCTGESGS